MSFATFDQVMIGAQQPREIIKAATPALVVGRPHSLFYLAGIPAAAVAPTPGIGGASLTSYAGQLPFTNPTAGLETRLARLQAMATIGGTLMLCDRLWHNSGIDPVSIVEQPFTASAAIPPRDQNGAALGEAVYAAVEVSGATGAGTPTLTLKYTNQANAAGKTATNTVPTVASSAIGAFYPIGLAAGDTGIRKAESLTLSATWTSGTIHTLLYRVLARLELTTGNTPNALDPLTGMLQRMWDNTVPFLVFIPNAVTATAISGHAIWSQG